MYRLISNNKNQARLTIRPTHYRTYISILNIKYRKSIINKNHINSLANLAPWNMTTVIRTHYLIKPHVIDRKVNRMIKYSKIKNVFYVLVHDYQLSGGRQNKWALTINGISYSYGQINSIMVPILVGYPNRNTQYAFQNSTVYKKHYSIPLGPTDSEEGDIVYDFSNFEQTFIHELIHALGIGTHSLSKTNGSRPDYEPIISSNNGLENEDYGDKFCVMGSGEYSVSLTAAYRDFLGWHNPVVREQLNDYGIYEVDLFPLNTKDDTAFIEVRIPNRISEFSALGYKNAEYFIEVRSQNDPQDSFLSNTFRRESRGCFC